jgi:hypothetical protein
MLAWLQTFGIKICAGTCFFAAWSGFRLEVVSKPQIMFESPASWRDFASDIFSLRCSASGPRIENGVRHTFWRMGISIRGTIRHEYWRTIGH